MPRRRKRFRGSTGKGYRTRIRLGPLLWMALIVVTYIGICRSPLTVTRRLKIEGALPSEHLRLAVAAQSISGVPSLQINPLNLESQVVANPAIRSADLLRSIFGTARLKIVYRTLVAKLATDPQVALSVDGMLFRTDSDTTKLPVLRLAPGTVQVSLGVVGTWDAMKISKLCHDVQRRWPQNELEVELLSDGHLCLNIDSGHVVLGSTFDLDQKLNIVVERLKRNPHELAEIKELVLTNPGRPTIVRKPGDRNL